MDPKDFGRAILARKASVITAVVVALALSSFSSANKEPVYASACSMFYQATAYDISENDARAYNPIGSLTDQAKFLAGPEMRVEAAKLLNIPPAELGRVVVTPESDNSSNLFQLKVSDTGGPTLDQKKSWNKYMNGKDRNPGLRAADVCNAHMQAYINFNLDDAREKYEQLRERKAKQLKDLEGQVAQKERDIAAKGGYDSAPFEVNDRNQIIRSAQQVREKLIGILDTLDSGITGGGKPNETAQAGANLTGDRKKDLFMGLLMGLVFGVGFALIREYFDDTVKDKESTQRELGVPVLTTMPSAEEFEGYGELSPGTMEAARALRATLGTLGVPHEKNILLVTSSLAKRRNTTLTALAAALAESGRSVLVIGSDLRGGRTHEAFGIANTTGLANVIRGQIPFEKAIRPAPSMEGVYIMPCGPVIGNPGELLASEEMAMTLRRAQRWADVVLLDAPPVLAAADSSILGSYADGIIMVLSAGQTNKSRAAEAKEQLVSAGGRVLGLVLTDSNEADRGGIADYGDDLGQNAGGWGAYDVSAYGDSYYDDVASPLGPRGTASRPASRSAAASRAGQRPTSSTRTPSVPKNAKTAGGRKSPSGKTSSPARKTSSPARKTATKRTTTTGRKTVAPARKTSAAKAKTETAKRAAPRKAAPAKAPARKSTSAARKPAKRPVTVTASTRSGSKTVRITVSTRR